MGSSSIQNAPIAERPAAAQPRQSFIKSSLKFILAVLIIFGVAHILNRSFDFNFDPVLQEEKNVIQEYEFIEQHSETDLDTSIAAIEEKEQQGQQLLQTGLEEERVNSGFAEEGLQDQNDEESDEIREEEQKSREDLDPASSKSQLESNRDEPRLPDKPPGSVPRNKEYPHAIKVVDQLPATSSDFKGLVGLRILEVVAAYSLKKLRELERLVESAADLCVAGAHVTMIIQTTEKKDDPRFEGLRKTMQCSGTGGSARLLVETFPPGIKLDLSMEHRRVMYDQLDDHDVFIYTEDDMDVRPSLVAAYLAETAALEAALPGLYAPGYPHRRYLVSFIRWEQNAMGIRGMDQRRTRSVEGPPVRVYWENRPQDYNVTSLEHAQGDEATRRRGYLTMANPHTAMWVLTRHQLRALRDLCSFDNPKPVKGANVIKLEGASRPEMFSVRVWVSSNQFAHCGFTRVIPLRAFEALGVHHLPDKNFLRKVRGTSKFTKDDKKDRILFSQELLGLIKKQANERGLLW